MKKLKLIISAGLMTLGLIATPLLMPTPAGAVVNPQEQACKGSGGTWDPAAMTCSGQSTAASLEDTVRSIVNILLFVIGVASVIMIILGGLRYVLSGGDQAGIKGAKDTIIYAVIGLVVAVLAYAIVNFVLGSLN